MPRMSRNKKSERFKEVTFRGIKSLVQETNIKETAMQIFIKGNYGKYHEVTYQCIMNTSNKILETGIRLDTKGFPR